MKQLLILIAAASLAVNAHAATDPALDKVLRQMDVASANFKSAEADLKSEFYERVVRDTSSQTGSIYFLRSAGGTEMGAVFTTPGKKYLHFDKGVGTLYDPVTKQTTKFGASQDRSRSESFLTLGFGGSGKDLERAWDIKLLGEDHLQDGGTSVLIEKLDLVAKEPAVRNMFTHIVIWIDPKRGISLKQESTTPEGDKRTATYSNIRYNSKVDTKKYAAPK